VWVNDALIILLVILWLSPWACCQDIQDDWSQPISYFQVALSYNHWKHNHHVNDACNLGLIAMIMSDSMLWFWEVETIVKWALLRWMATSGHCNTSIYYTKKVKRSGIEQIWCNSTLFSHTQCKKILHWNILESTLVKDMPNQPTSSYPSTMLIKPRSHLHFWGLLVPKFQSEQGLAD
jgi:hypothetical protein